METKGKPTGPRKSKLIVHLDVNETIMACDPAGGDSFEHCLNKIICKNAFIRKRSVISESDMIGQQDQFGRWCHYCWHDGSTIDPNFRSATISPPPLLSDGEFNRREGCVSWYKSPLKTRDLAATFTDPGNPGSIFRDVYERLRSALCAPPGTDERLLLESDNQYFNIFPAVFHMIEHLIESKRDHTVVLRTFGSDMEDVGKAFDAFAEGLHPYFSGESLRNHRRSYAFSVEQQFTGRYRDIDGHFTVSRGSSSNTMDEDEVVDLIQNGPKVLGICEHYTWWKDNHYRPEAGKPLWLTQNDDLFHHVFFDDNIHNNASDSIVAVRMRRTSSDKFKPLSGKTTTDLHGIVLVRCPTHEPILNHEWFVEQLLNCEREKHKLKGLIY